jgi:uncharacterized protein DUF1572
MERTTLAAFEAEFNRSRNYVESSISQLDDAHLHIQINHLQNSIAVIVQHMAGNMLSRFTDFLTTDGEKTFRDRDAEFIDRELSRADLLMLWNRGWTCVFGALAPLTDTDLSRVVVIRREPHSVSAALARQVAHYAWHAGQTSLIAKHIKGEQWNYLTIPPRGSVEFNRKRGL